MNRDLASDLAYLEGQVSVALRRDADKKLKCKQGYVQRGSACQKIEGKKSGNLARNIGVGLGAAALAGGVAAIAAKNRGDKNTSIPFPTKGNMPFAEKVENSKTPPSSRRLLALGLPVAATSSLIFAGVSQVKNDIKKVSQDVQGKELIKPNESASQETLDRYEKEFKPGDLIKKSFQLTKEGGFVDHYAIYAGDGNIIEMEGGAYTGASLWKKNINSPSGTTTTPYELVTDFERDNKKMPRYKTLALAENLVGAPFSWDGVETNCESIARLLATGEGRSTQGESVSSFTRFVGKIAAKVVLARDKPLAKEKNAGISLNEMKKTMEEHNYNADIIYSIFKPKIDAELSAYQEKVAKSGQATSTKKQNNDSLLSQDPDYNRLGIRPPEEYEKIADRTASRLRGVSRSLVKEQMYKSYLVGLIGIGSTKAKK